jgi:hypothetical protein
LRLDERQHVRVADLRGLLADHREEHLQIERGGQHRVRARSGGDHVQVVVEQRVSKPRHLAIAKRRTDQARHEHQPPPEPTEKRGNLT